MTKIGDFNLFGAGGVLPNSQKSSGLSSNGNFHLNTDIANMVRENEQQEFKPEKEDESDTKKTAESKPAEENKEAKEAEKTNANSGSENEKAKEAEKTKVSDYDPSEYYIPKSDKLDDTVTFKTEIANLDPGPNTNIQIAACMKQLDDYLEKLFDSPLLKGKTLVSWEDYFPEFIDKSGNVQHDYPARTLVFDDGTVVQMQSAAGNDPVPIVNVISYSDSVDPENPKQGDKRQKTQYISLGDGYYGTITIPETFEDQSADTQDPDAKGWTDYDLGYHLSIGGRISDVINGVVDIHDSDGNIMLRDDDPEKYDELFEKLEKEYVNSMVGWA